jgi:uncharacterized protein (DUF58 family)
MPKVEWSFFMPAEDHRQLKKLTAILMARLTPWGRAIAGAGLFSMVITSVGTQIAAYLLPSFLVAAFLTATLLTLSSMPEVEARRILLPTVAGGRYVYKVVVKNTGKRVLRNLSIFEPCLPYGLYADADHPEYRNSADWLEPGETATFTLVFRTPRRGIFELSPLLACSAYPSGIIRSVREVGPRMRFVAYPRLIQTQGLPLGQHRTYQRGGISQSTRVGDSNEFASTREYRSGDRLRDIHWASTAKTGKLIVKEYVEEYFVRTGIYIDTELKRFEKHAGFEARLSLCAGLCRQLGQRDHILDIFASGKTRHIQSGRGLGSFPHILEFLAGIDGDDRLDFHQGFLQLREYAPELSELIVLFKDWDRERSLFVEQLRGTGLKVRPVILRDGTTTLAVRDESVLKYTTKELLKYV